MPASQNMDELYAQMTEKDEAASALELGKLDDDEKYSDSYDTTRETARRSDNDRKPGVA